jgi:predicted nucleic acid-binding protein
MNRYVLDASAALAWYLPEPFADAARQWQQDMLRGSVRLLVPSLRFWEVGNVLRTYVRRREIGRDVAEEIYALHLDAPLEEMEPARPQVLAAAFDFDATVYDAVYIALSLAYDAPLVTGERTTAPRVAKLGDRIRTLSATG